MNHKKWKRQGSMVKFKYTWKAYKIKSKNIFHSNLQNLESLANKYLDIVSEINFA